MFQHSINLKSFLFVQVGDPRQNSKIGKINIAKTGSKQISIPARSPELNPIENLFNLVKQKLG